ncbi:unnamed protein product [Diatraea saccharalis]|uniref:Uncharacterized protein n=1 Tax=Diatraea saccharalis TaxID=40085 RepID=A0A9N9R264_9NEOP|nr:unnamed protein product [Diatraea saccharalis]
MQRKNNISNFLSIFRLNLSGNSGATFSSDLHVTAELNLNLADKGETYVSHITMDINEVESNVTYSWTERKGVDNEDYILLGPPKIVVRNSRTPTYFLQQSTYLQFLLPH